MTVTHLNVGCGPHRAPAPWWNTDVVATAHVRPDQLVSIHHPLPFPSGSVERIYLGHVLEHLPWDTVVPFLTHLRALLRPGGELLAVGPDVELVLKLWKAGDCDWRLVEQVLEHHEPQEDLGDWEGSRHEWNCTEERLETGMVDAGFRRVRPLDLTDPDLDGWPLVSRVGWQAAVHGRAAC